MFEVAAVTPQEATRLQGQLNLSEDGQHLRQPCRALDGCRCTTYLDRPRACGAFQCLVLASLDAGEMTPEEADEAIQDVLARRRRLAEAVGTTDPTQALERARQQLAAGTADEEVAVAFRRLRQALLLMQLQPEDSLFKGPGKPG